MNQKCMMRVILAAAITFFYYVERINVEAVQLNNSTRMAPNGALRSGNNYMGFFCLINVR